jgi:hypothetical protein
MRDAMKAKWFIKWLLFAIGSALLFGGIALASNGQAEWSPFLIAPGAIALVWVGSIEYRLRGKVGREQCAIVSDIYREQSIRLESHMYDLLKERGINPSIEPPEEVKKVNNKR